MADFDRVDAGSRSLDERQLGVLEPDLVLLPEEFLHTGHLAFKVELVCKGIGALSAKLRIPHESHDRVGLGILRLATVLDEELQSV